MLCDHFHFGASLLASFAHFVRDQFLNSFIWAFNSQRPATTASYSVAVTSPRSRLDYIEHIPDGDPTTGSRERRTCYTSASYTRKNRDFAKKVTLLRDFEQLLINDPKVLLTVLLVGAFVRVLVLYPRHFTLLKSREEGVRAEKKFQLLIHWLSKVVFLMKTPKRT